MDSKNGYTPKHGVGKNLITPHEAVARLINCFETANREINEALNLKVQEKELKAKVRIFIGDTFKNAMST